VIVIETGQQTWTAVDAQNAVHVLEIRIWFPNLCLEIECELGWTILHALAGIEKTIASLRDTTQEQQHVSSNRPTSYADTCFTNKSL